MSELRTMPMPSRAPAAPRTRRTRGKTSLRAAAEPMVWLTGGALLAGVVMIVGLLGLIVYFGAATFWPQPVVRFAMHDGGTYMGEVSRREEFSQSADRIDALAPEARERATRAAEARDGKSSRVLVRTGNYRLTNSHFEWIDASAVASESRPEDAVVVEPLEWGRVYGFPAAFVHITHYVEPRGADGAAKTPAQKRDEVLALAARSAPRLGGALQAAVRASAHDVEVMTVMPLDALDALEKAGDIVGLCEVVEGIERAWPLFLERHDRVRDAWRERRRLEKYDAGEVNRREEEARLAVREAELALADAAEGAGDASSLASANAREALERARAQYADVQEAGAAQFAEIRRKIDALNRENGKQQLLVATAGFGAQPPVRFMMGLESIVRAYLPNRAGVGELAAINLSRWWEFLSEEPREANSEGGVFPAIFGTVIMTLLMAIAVVPFGVLASLYLREYAKAGPIVSTVRIAVNNLAGVPSIVYGVFGLGFFCYGIGGFIDGGPAYALPRASWFVLLGSIVLVGAVAFLALYAGMTRPGERVHLRHRALRWAAAGLWAACALATAALVATTPFFDGFYRASLPNPTFGKGALIWSSFTLALLTLPVVIVATEEALASVPNSMREGSYACGAGKWQTIRRIVFPRAMPGIMTGMILAMARGAGEVAPLMLVGAVKLAPELPFDWLPPFGLNRSFMHLGFHIYDVGFQSQNSEAAKPMVFTTTLLLIAIVAALNVTAIWLRSRLRRRFVSDQF